ncbi:MAG: hypothetical protein ACAI35_06180 [Candidatus Methylacidiphilales bacterium]|nr:hypothetical protein [Candidatus Methylacidiphilales bacterium]
MDPISGFFEGALQPVVRLAQFAICMLAGCWLGLYLGMVDNFAHLPLRQALGHGWEAMITHYPSIQNIGAALPDVLIKGLLSVWKFPLVLCVPWLLFRTVIVDTGVLPLGGLTLAAQSLQTYTIAGTGTAFSVTLLLVMTTAAVAWHLWCWWRETNWVEALDGPQYVPKEDKKQDAAEDDMFMPPVSTSTAAESGAYPYSGHEGAESMDEAASGETAPSAAGSFANLYADDTAAGDSSPESATLLPGETEEEQYHRLRQAREAQEREERESRARLQQQKKGGPGAKGHGRV